MASQNFSEHHFVEHQWVTASGNSLCMLVFAYFSPYFSFLWLFATSPSLSHIFPQMLHLNFNVTSQGIKKWEFNIKVFTWSLRNIPRFILVKKYPVIFQIQNFCSKPFMQAWRCKWTPSCISLLSLSIKSKTNMNMFYKLTLRFLIILQII